MLGLIKQLLARRASYRAPVTQGDSVIYRGRTYLPAL